MAELLASAATFHCISDRTARLAWLQAPAEYSVPIYRLEVCSILTLDAAIGRRGERGKSFPHDDRHDENTVLGPDEEGTFGSSSQHLLRPSWSTFSDEIPACDRDCYLEILPVDCELFQQRRSLLRSKTALHTRPERQVRGFCSDVEMRL